MILKLKILNCNYIINILKILWKLHKKIDCLRSDLLWLQSVFLSIFTNVIFSGMKKKGVLTPFLTPAEEY